MKKLWLGLIFSTILGFAEEGDLKWRFDADAGNIYNSPAIGYDGIIYFAPTGSSLFALTPSGELLWECVYVRASASLAIGWHNTIYYGGSYRGAHSFNALTPLGELEWSFEIEYPAIPRSSPAIATDGSIYFTVREANDDYYLYALTNQGELKWKHKLHEWTPARKIYSSPAIGIDGNLYIGSPDENIYCFSPSGEINWRFETGELCSSPAIDSKGNIYIQCGGDLFSLTSNGDLRWKYHFYTWSTDQSPSPVIDPNDVIYIGGIALHAFDSDGNLMWEYDDHDVNLQLFGTPAIGADGIIYVPGTKDFIYALTPSGELKWKQGVGTGFYAGIQCSSPVIAEDGTICVGGCDGCIYAYESSSSGLALSPWPKFRHDNYNTGRYGWYNVSPVSILVPQEGNIYHNMVPAACFKNVGLFDVSGFYCHAEIVSRSYYTLPYHVSVLVSDTLAPGDSVHVSFAEWVCDDNASYIATYYTTSEIDTPWVCMSMSVEFQGCAGIEEDGSQYLPSFEIVFLSNSRVVFRYSDFLQGFNVSVFDVSGQQIDELYSASPSGTITWGEGQTSGVYFASVQGDYTTHPQKFVLIK